MTYNLPRLEGCRLGTHVGVGGVGVGAVRRAARSTWLPSPHGQDRVIARRAAVNVTHDNREKRTIIIGGSWRSCVSHLGRARDR